MALLTPAAIALLERLPATWTDARELDVEEAAPAFLELRREHLVETRIWPPPLRGGYRSRATNEIDDRVSRRNEVQRTARGALRLLRLRDGRMRSV
jgi:hypothetical protein